MAPGFSKMSTNFQNKSALSDKVVNAGGPCISFILYIIKGQNYLHDKTCYKDTFPEICQKTHLSI